MLYNREFSSSEYLSKQHVRCAAVIFNWNGQWLYEKRKNFCDCSCDKLTSRNTQTIDCKLEVNRGLTGPLAVSRHTDINALIAGRDVDNRQRMVTTAHTISCWRTYYCVLLLVRKPLDLRRWSEHGKRYVLYFILQLLVLQIRLADRILAELGQFVTVTVLLPLHMSIRSEWDMLACN